MLWIQHTGSALEQVSCYLVGSLPTAKLFEFRCPCTIVAGFSKIITILAGRSSKKFTRKKSEFLTRFVRFKRTTIRPAFEYRDVLVLSETNDRYSLYDCAAGGCLFEFRLWTRSIRPTANGRTPTFLDRLPTLAVEKMGLDWHRGEQNSVDACIRHHVRREATSWSWRYFFGGIHITGLQLRGLVLLWTLHGRQ